jgi:hypothetical protein
MRARLSAIMAGSCMLLAHCDRFSSSDVPAASPDAAAEVGPAPPPPQGSPCSSGTHLVCIDFDGLEGGLPTALPNVSGAAAFAIDDSASVSTPSSLTVRVDPSFVRAFAERKFDESARRVVGSVAYRRDAYSDLFELNLFGVQISYAGGTLDCYTRVRESTGSFALLNRPSSGTETSTGRDAIGLALPKGKWGKQRIELDLGAPPHCALYVDDRLEASIEIPSGLTGVGVGVSLGADVPKFTGDAGTVVMRYDDLVIDVEK